MRECSLAEHIRAETRETELAKDKRKAQGQEAQESRICVGRSLARSRGERGAQNARQGHPHWGQNLRAMGRAFKRGVT